MLLGVVLQKSAALSALTESLFAVNEGIRVCRNKKLPGFELEAPPHVQIRGAFCFYTLLCPLFTLSKMAVFTQVLHSFGARHCDV